MLSIMWWSGLSTASQILRRGTHDIEVVGSLKPVCWNQRRRWLLGGDEQLPEMIWWAPDFWGHGKEFDWLIDWSLWIFLLCLWHYMWCRKSTDFDIRPICVWTLALPLTGCASSYLISLNLCFFIYKIEVIHTSNSCSCTSNPVTVYITY